MSKKHKILSSVLAALLMLQGCSRFDKNFKAYAESINVSTYDNALRASLLIKYRKSCTYSIQFWKKNEGEETAKNTAPRRVESGEDTQILKFLSPDTEYRFRIIADGGISSNIFEFKTGSLPPDLPQYTVEQSDGKTFLDGLLLQWDASKPGYVTLSDFDGNIVWYQAYGKGIRTAWFDNKTGHIAILAGFKHGESYNDFYRLAEDIIISDLDGNIILKKKATEDFIANPHHEFQIMPDGNLLILSNFIKSFDLSSLPSGNADTPIWGDGFFVCSPDGAIIKKWDCFNELNPLKVSYIDPVKFSNDYVHANSVTIDSEGNYYMTLNRLSELWKIDGKTGEVIYRIGENGNVNLEGGDYPQGGLHAAFPLSPDRILCYDNGKKLGHSRAVLFNVNSSLKTAKYEKIVNLPPEWSSSNRSNAQLIGNDIVLLSSTVTAKAVFSSLEGKTIRVINRTGISYRAYWIDKEIIKKLQL